MSEGDDDTLVEVFRTADPGLLPLASATLDSASIDHAVRSVEEGAPSVYGHHVGFGEAEGASALVVRAADAARARDLLADLENAAGTSLAAPVPSTEVSPAATSPAPRSPTGPREFRLAEMGSGRTVGDISAEQLQFLIDALEEESSDDHDYYIDTSTLDLLEREGADAELLSMLRRALGSKDGMDIAWSRR